VNGYLWACPRTLESAARDFLLVRNGERTRAALADPDSWYDFYVTDFKRRIAATYGLASSYNVHTTQIWSPGWNRRLLASAGPDPEQASERILQRVCALARLGVPASPKEANAEAGDPADPTQFAN
jgi:hypothetical protein